ncbi:ABC transporter substrate-binding protein [Gordonia sinesedis]
MAKRVLIVVAILVTCLGAVVGCSDDRTGSGDSGLVIGSDGSAALRVMAQIYAGALRNTGAPVADTSITGDDAALLERMDQATLDLFPALTGSLLAVLAPDDPRGDTATADGGADEGYSPVYAALNRALPQGVSVGDATPVSALPQIFIASSLATSTGVSDLSDCARLPQLPLVAVGGADSATDDATLAAFRAAGCRFGPVTSVPDAQAVLDRVAAGTAVGVLTALDAAGGTTGQVQALRVPSADERGPSPAAAGPTEQNLVPVFRTAALTGDQVKTVNKVAGEITTADLATMARAVEDGSDPRERAAAWLAEHGL